MNHSKLVGNERENPNSTDIFEDNLVDTFYPEQPSDMEDVWSVRFSSRVHQMRCEGRRETCLWKTRQDSSPKPQVV